MDPRTWTLSSCLSRSVGTPKTRPNISRVIIRVSEGRAPPFSAHPTSVVGEGVQLVVGDEVGLEVLLPIAYALHPVVWVAVDVDRAAEVVSRPAVRLVDSDLFLVGVANCHARNVLLARELPGAAPDVVTWIFGYATDESGLEFQVSLLCEVECPGNRTSYGNRVLSYSESEEVTCI